MADGLRAAAYDRTFRGVMSLVERDLVPDALLRAGIRRLLAARAAEASAPSGEARAERLQAFVDELRALPIAVQTKEANEQHYEVPTEYYLKALGPRRKYSSCLYADKGTTLAEAEEAMLALCAARAGLADGQDVLELGCGWGSWCLWTAARFPGSRVTALSNSRTQKAFIDAEAARQGLKNLTVVTADVVTFAPPPGAAYDRVVSVEMFEHMKNYEQLLGRIARWLRPGGKLFVHIFAHAAPGLPYHFEARGADDWMARHFFSGGTMPSDDLLPRFQRDLALERQWWVNGRHYSRTLEDWLRLHDVARAEVLPLFEESYGAGQGLKWFVYWRLFYLSCSELFAYDGGERWGVSHYLFTKRAAAAE